MQARRWCGVALLWLAACTTSPPPSSDGAVVGAPTKASSQAQSGQAQSGGAHGGDWAVRVIGTPFYWAVKAVSCVTTVVIAAPASAILALRPEVYEAEAPVLGDTVAGYCGSPWVLPLPDSSG